MLSQSSTDGGLSAQYRAAYNIIKQAASTGKSGGNELAL